MTDKNSSYLTETITKLMEIEYDFSGEISRLAGENENYLIKKDDGTCFVLKLADDNTTAGMIEIEHLAVDQLINAKLPIRLPRVILTRTGSVQARLMTKDRKEIRGRLLEFVKGKAWCQALPATNELLENLGTIIAQMNMDMSFIVHPDSKRTHHWDLARADQHRSKIYLIDSLEKRQILEWVFHLYAAIVRPLFESLPKSLIHGDINDDNVLVSDERVVGILDFGDCLTNPTVCDLAIALAYHTLDEDNPLEAAATIIGAYHKIRPLSIDEMMAIFPLMCARLAVSVIISAQRKKIDPTMENWFVSEKRAWKKLEVLSTTGPAQAAIILASKTNLEPFENRGASVTELLKNRQRLIAPSVSPSYDKPLKFLKGKGQYLYDYNGRPFLDLYNNVCHVGHCHPKVVQAGQKQMARLNTNTRYLYDGLTQYAQKLCDTLPRELDTCFFVNSGSEANELALRIARVYTHQKDMLVVENAFHGHTSSMIDISPYKFMGQGGKGEPEPWVHVVPVPDGYRGKFKGRGEDTGKAYGNEVGEILKNIPKPIAGFITESLLSCGGQVIPPHGYFKTAFKHVRDAGGLCIADEIQAGFGRVGSHFWAFELQSVVPDIVVMGKPIGNGHPMSAVVTRKEIADSFANGMEFFATFGGNPVSCAIGMAVLDVIKDEGLQGHAKQVGARMLEGLNGLKNKHDIIGDVRGIGLFIGIELIKDKSTLAPATRKAAEMVNRLKNRGILLGTDGPFNNVIKIKPPMVITKEDADMFIRVFDDALSNMKNAG
ncbi:MAG: aminotransferase class III-fold pyridoxal phosphate-dependent enzyme [Desulfobacula sp.]|uniref:aminotransferase class III-fold pyridoxal phosphate-dependent enzyme n=1 Tax=Desulfobacula sp. TaxID=2593537 RepID=UPI0025C46866|nr:aminotransferase class III-fold pyridoxal phosphate-dependent enzyme [Desulfobacula sp.]MCD4720716.1 aminotransferase class III-fold pyridoxal phosphate-dependent enzyme [Desulfobacula sp.]